MRTVAILSGKGGVGKTSLAVNLGLTLAKFRSRVLLVDGDLALGSVDLFLGLSPDRNAGTYLDGGCSLADTLAIGPRGIAVLPAAAGRSDLAELDRSRRARLTAQLSALSRRFDWTVIDLPAGIGSTVLDLAGLADTAIILATPEPASILHAYAAAKLLAGRGAKPRLVVNRVRSESESSEIASRIARTASRHLGSTPAVWGTLPEDPAVHRAAMSRDPFVVTAPSAPASARVRELARRLAADEPPAGSPRLSGGVEELLPLSAA